MNENWSRYVQGVRTLFDSRSLRFHDAFRAQFEGMFALDREKPLSVLEIGCGPGALAGAMKKWYPAFSITGIDRDSAFIRFAGDHVAGVRFLEADATQLPFADESFDVSISNTVSEHIEPGAFFGEQLRVLRKGGACIVLSSRRGYNHMAECVKNDEMETRFWEKAAKHDDSMEKYEVCRYPATEQELPALMETHGFRNVTTGYAVCPLTPDDPKYPKEMAHAMINACRVNDLEALASVRLTMPGIFPEAELSGMEKRVNEKYDLRLRLYDSGEKQWDTSTSVIMMVRGEK